MIKSSGGVVHYGLLEGACSENPKYFSSLLPIVTFSMRVLIWLSPKNGGWENRVGCGIGAIGRRNGASKVDPEALAVILMGSTDQYPQNWRF